MLKEIKNKNGFTYHTIHFYRGQRSAQRSTGTSIRREAERIDRQRQAEFEAEVTEQLSGQPVLPPLTLELMRQWKLQAGRDEKLHAGYVEKDTNRYFELLAQYDWKLKNVTLEQRWEYVRMRRAQLTKSGRAPFYRSLRRELYILGWGLKEAKRRQYQIVLDLTMPKFSKEDRDIRKMGHFLSKEEFQTWRAHLPADLADQALVQIMTGLRHGELRAFELSFVRTSTPCPTPGVVAYADLPQSVCNRERTIALTQEVYDALQRIIPVSPWQKTKAFAKAAKAAGLARTPHERDLRTTFANVAASLGGDSKGVDLAMGHVGNGTAPIYQRTTDPRMAKIALTLAAEYGDGPTDQPTTVRCPHCNGSVTLPGRVNLDNSEKPVK